MCEFIDESDLEEIYRTSQHNVKLIKIVNIKL